MFDTLLTWLGILWETAKGTAKTIYDSIFGLFAWIVATSIAVVGITKTVSGFVYDQIQSLPNYFTAVTSTMSGGELHTTATNWLDNANVFFPVQELFTLIGGLSIVWLSSMLYRLVKSWIPTVN